MVAELHELLLQSACESWMLPQAHRLWGLAVFPIYPRPSWNADAGPKLRYTPLPLALARAQAEVLEIAEAGVLLKNRSDEKVLGLDGDSLGPQSRVLETSVLLGRGDTRLPASFVERGRWQEGSAQIFTSLLRRGYRAEGRSLWRDVEPRPVPSVGPERAVLQAYVDALPYPSHAVGLAVAVGGKVRGLDLFDQPATCQHYWPQLVRAGAAAALSAPHHAPVAENLLEELSACQLTRLDSPGLGQEIRVVGPAASGQALIYEGVVVHLSLFGRNP